MSQTAPPESSTDSFAGFLASVAAPQKGLASRWDDDLADDIATISYEQALRAQARYEPLSAGDRPAPAGKGNTSTLHRTTDTPEQEIGLEPTQCKPASTRDCRRTASITIRLSEPECAQLRMRAAEAGLSVSAYLRSCTLEVESLRAQVKEALAQLRQSSSKPPESSAPATTSRGTAPANWRRLWPFGHSTRFTRASPESIQGSVRRYSFWHR
jgi:hypothetical protein